MRKFITLPFFVSLCVILTGQVNEFQNQEGASQIRLVSNDETERFGLRMNNDGILRIYANDLDEVLFVVMTLGDDRTACATYVAGERVYSRELQIRKEFFVDSLAA